MDAQNQDLRWLSVDRLLEEPPFPPRVDDAPLDFLLSSVRLHGVLAPVFVRELDDGRLQVICGHRRLRAAKENGIDEIPGLVAEMTDAEAIRCYLTENICRQELGEVAREEVLELLRGLRSGDERAVEVAASRSARTRVGTGRSSIRETVTTADDETRSRLDALQDETAQFFATVRETRRIDMEHAGRIVDALLEFPESAIGVESFDTADWGSRHALAASWYTSRLAPEGFSELGTRGYALAGLLHDVGMVFLPDRLRNASSESLGVSDRRELQTHTRIGHALISSAGKEFAEIALAAKDHHERLDGSGYPNGSQGGLLGRLARAVGVVDAFCAMTTPRGPRGTFEVELALEKLSRSAGGLYDGTLVEELQRVVRRPARARRSERAVRNAAEPVEIY